MDNALQVIRILTQNAEPGIDVANAQVQWWLADAGMDSIDSAAGLATAGANGWIEDGSRPGFIGITAAGFAAGQP